MMQTCGEMVLDWVRTLKDSLSLQQMYKAFLMCFLGSHKDFYQNNTSVFRIGHSKIDLLCLIVFALLCSVVLCQCCCLCQYFEFQFVKNQVESNHWSDTERVENGCYYDLSWIWYDFLYQCSEGCKITMTASSVVKDLRICFSMCIALREQPYVCAVLYSSFCFIIIYND